MKQAQDINNDILELFGINDINNIASVTIELLPDKLPKVTINKIIINELDMNRVNYNVEEYELKPKE